MQRRTFLDHGYRAASAAVVGGVGVLGGWAGGPGAAWAQAGPPPSEATAPHLPAVGSTLAVPPLALLDGTTFSPTLAKGQVLVLYWWASTCPFCALQSPEMQKLWVKHKASGLQMLALSVDRKQADALPYLHKRGYTFPAGWVTPAFEAALRKPKGLPITVVVGRDGKVLQAEKGQLFPEDVEQLARWWA